MSSSTNPLLTSLIPGSNPTGSTLAVPYGPSGGTTTSGQNPLMPAVPSGTSAPASPYSNYNFSAYASPYTTATGTTPAVPSTGTPAVPTATGTTGTSSTAVALGAGGTAGQSLASSPALQTSLNTSLTKNYGSGLATLLENFLGSGAGFNQDAINQLIAAMQPQFAQNQQNLLTSFGSTGNRFSSGAQIGDAALLSQEGLDVGQLESQMYEQSVNDYLNTLMGIGTTTANRIAGEPSTWDAISGALGLAGTGAQGVSSAISSLDPNADTSILDAIGALFA